MDHEDIENRLKAVYGATAAGYRKDDERHVTGKDYQRLCEILSMLSSSFGRPITVLDAGCGTGRYFHCLKSTQKLVGLDVSPEMLREARHPVREADVSVRQVDLICASIHTQSFPEASFNLIYSIGLFGNGCGLTRELLSKFHRWLAPDGRVFFDALDSGGLPPALRARTQLRKFFHQLCPRRIRTLFGRRQNQALPLHIYSREEILGLFESCGFFAVAVYPQECHMPLGQGRKLQCLGLKSEGQSRCRCRAA